MHQLRLPLPSSTGRCRSSNVDSTRLFAKFGPRIKKREGGCQPARFAKCGVGWRKIGCEITPTASFIILFLSPLSLFLPPKVGLIWTDRGKDICSRHRVLFITARICRRHSSAQTGPPQIWGCRGRGRRDSVFTRVPSSRSLPPSRRDSRVRFVDRFLRRPILHYVLRLWDRRPPRPADAKGVKSLGILWCDEVS